MFRLTYFRISDGHCFSVYGWTRSVPERQICFTWSDGIRSRLASATWIGNAVMTGEIKSMEGQNPLTVSATGGVAIFLLVFVLGYWFYIS